MESSGRQEIAPIQNLERVLIGKVMQLFRNTLWRAISGRRDYISVSAAMARIALRRRVA